WLDRMEHGEAVEASPSEVRELVQIYSRGFTGGMYGGRAGRDYVTRDQPDNRGIELGVVASSDGREVIVELVEPIESGDGLGFEPPAGARGKATGFTAERVRTLVSQPGAVRQSIRSSARIPAGWRVVRSSHAALLLRARESFASLPAVARERRTRLDVRLFGQAGAPLRFVATADGDTVKGASTLPLVPARNRALGTATLREQFGRLGETPFVLGALDHEAVGDGLFIPLSELNHLRQAATDELLLRRDWAETARIAAREGAVDSALEDRK